MIDNARYVVKMDFESWKSMGNAIDSQNCEIPGHKGLIIDIESRGQTNFFQFSRLLEQAENYRLNLNAQG
jgi:hypothetical protein